MRIDRFAGSTAPTINTGSDVISKLKPGDNVRAQILENLGKELSLRFIDGSVVTASAASTVEAAEGEFVNLTFRGTINEKPAFELADKLPQAQTDKSLEDLKATVSALKLPLTEQNLQLARALLAKNLPVNTETMSKMLELTGRNPDLKPDAAAFLTSTNLSADTNNIEKLQSLLAGRLKIGNDISELSNMLKSAGDKSTLEGINLSEVKTLVDKVSAQLLAKGVIALTKGSADLTVKPGEQNTSANDKAGTTSSDQVVIKDSAENKAGAARSELVDNRASVASRPESIDSKTVMSGQGSFEGKTGIVRPGSAEVQAGNLSQETADSIASGKAAEKLNQSAQLKEAAFISRTSDNPSNINQANISERIINLLKGDTLPGKSDFQLLNAFNSELVSLMDSTELSHEELSAARQLAGRQNLPEAAAESLKSLFIRIGQANDEIDPSRLYKDIDKAIQTLKSEILQLPQGLREAAANIVFNLESNMNFINQLNTYSSYVQLPLSLFDKNTTGELYMLKRGSKAKKLDPSNMTVLLSLDTEKIGRIDTLLSVDKKNISTNFRVENSEVFPVLKEKHKELYNSLMEKGFRLVDFTYRLMEEPINIVNFEVEAKKEFLKNSNNIDISI